MATDSGQPNATIELPSGPAVIKAWAPWCSSCIALGPVVDEIADKTGIALVGLQVDAHPDLVEHLAVRSVPTLIALDDATELGRLHGLQPRDAIQSLFNLAAGTGTDIRRRTPTSLVATRGATAAVLILAGFLTGSVALGCIGALLGMWAVVGLIPR